MSSETSSFLTWVCCRCRRIEEDTDLFDKKYHMTFRLIDDVCAVDCPDFKELCSSYPDCLSLDNTTLEDDSVNFLGMNLKFTESGLQIKVYDKRKDYPFKVVRFPNLLSEIPEHQAYGVFIGLLHRFYRICNYPKFFLTASVDVAQTLDNQGCKYMKLFKVFPSILFALIIFLEPDVTASFIFRVIRAEKEHGADKAAANMVLGSQSDNIRW